MNISSVNFLTHVHCNQVEQENETPSSSVQEIAKRTLKQETEKACGKRKKIRAKRKKKKTPVTEPWKSREAAEKAGLGNRYVDISEFPKELHGFLSFTSSNKVTVFEIVLIELLMGIELHVERLLCNWQKPKLFVDLTNIVKKLYSLIPIINPEYSIQNEREATQKIIGTLKSIDSKLLSDCEKSQRLFNLLHQVCMDENFSLKNWTCFTANVTGRSKDHYPNVEQVFNYSRNLLLGLLNIYERGFLRLLKNKYPDVLEKLNENEETKVALDELHKLTGAFQHEGSIFTEYSKKVDHSHGEYFELVEMLNRICLEYNPILKALLLMPKESANSNYYLRMVDLNFTVFSTVIDLFSLLLESLHENNPFYKRGEIYCNLDGLSKNLNKVDEDARKVCECAIRSGFNNYDITKVFRALKKCDKWIGIIKNINHKSYGGYARAFRSVLELKKSEADFSKSYIEMNLSILEWIKSQNKSDTIDELTNMMGKSTTAFTKNRAKFCFYLIELELLFGTSSRAVDKYRTDFLNNESSLESDDAASPRKDLVESKQEEPEIQEEQVLVEVKNDENLEETVNEKLETDEAAALVPCSSIPRKKKKESAHNVKPKKLLKKLAKTGWEFLRQKGSHRQFSHPRYPQLGLATVPFHSGRTTLSTGVAGSVYELIERSRELDEE